MYIQTRVKSGDAPAKSTGVRVAIYQPNGGLCGSVEAIEKSLDLLKEKAKIAKESYDAQLISVPELFLSGYAFQSDEVAHSICLSLEDVMQKVAPIASEIGITVVCPYAQKEMHQDKEYYYDSILVVDENGELLKNYKKTHLWGPDENRLWSSGYTLEEEGEAFTVFSVNGFNVGVLNCYEAEFAELSRILVVRGARLIVIPTAADLRAVVEGVWTTQTYPDVSKNLIPARSLENNVFVAYNNFSGVGYTIENTQRVDRVEYLGNSIVADPHGKIMSEARHNEEVMLIVDCVDEEYEPTHPCGTNYIKDRRPSLYGHLIKD
ncbi:MAG: nitrilase-related carbon-nitrogen hydrolase [Campylobacterota bacterium]|nr:nitrilase-related carbon-nitrogen hydrolase [Campylobacterota bacterium]